MENALPKLHECITNAFMMILESKLDDEDDFRIGCIKKITAELKNDAL